MLRNQSRKQTKNTAKNLHLYYRALSIIQYILFILSEVEEEPDYDDDYDAFLDSLADVIIDKQYKVLHPRIILVFSFSRYF